MIEIILASGSPRRRELLESLGVDFKVIASNVDEKIDWNLSYPDIVKSLAHQKARKVFDENTDTLVIGSDTIVVVDNEILGKPHNEEEAKEMMRKLRNKEHQVMTGVCFLSKKEEHCLVDISTVYFNDISDEEIAIYCKSKEPYDKAGGYAIQGWAGKYIRKIDGNFYTIVGLPLDKVNKYLKEFMANEEA